MVEIGVSWLVRVRERVLMLQQSLYVFTALELVSLSRHRAIGEKPAILSIACSNFLLRIGAASMLGLSVSVDVKGLDMYEM